jgi:hypothetical protein
MSEYVLPSSMTSPPIKALVPPGECQFTPDFTSVTLLERVAVSETTNVLRFATPNDTQPLNLSTCACILAKADLPKGDSVTETEPVIRPYTPISTNAQIGSFDLLIKVRNLPTDPVSSVPHCRLFISHTKCFSYACRFVGPHYGVLLGIFRLLCAWWTV